IGPELLTVRGRGVNGACARGHCLNQLVRQGGLVVLKRGKQGQEVTRHLVGDFFLRKKAACLYVSVPGGTCEVRRTDVDPYASPPNNLCMVAFHKSAREPVGFAGQKFLENRDTYSHVLVE